MATKVTERYVLQAHLGKMGWCIVNSSAVNGWWEYENHEHRARDGHSGAHTYADALAFAFPEHAEAALMFFATLPQAHDLRILKALYVVTEDVAFGPVITTKGTPDSGQVYWKRPASHPRPAGHVGAL